MNRREALALLGALAFAPPRLWAQTRPTARSRVFLGNGHGPLLEAGGTLKAWLREERSDGLATDYLGLGHNNPLAGYTLATIPNLTNVVTAAAGNGCSFAVLADGRILAWGWNSGSR